MKKNKLKRPRTDEEMAKAYADAWDDDRIDEEFRKGVHSKEMLDRLDAYIKEQLNETEDGKEEK
ncbi:hypothetical protein IKQ26_00110 [bacterium]|nr:hypothetical protein [bacterium]